ncbi:PE-PPE domain-containing protein [Mycolicibacterium palauense]|uniref:PE-PPE domain-containing protein n=1 Tax=Mycolicibacterium palauense TaxID=2034511 RepID=UPI00159B9543|nr:PE-PPE domain-containing protein [Mycolicibacterium palauense]
MLSATGIATATALLPLPTAAPASAATIDPPLESPATVLTLSIFKGITDELQGSICQTGNPCVRLKYNALWYREGVQVLDDAMHNTPGPKIIFGYSQGGQVVTEWLRDHADDPDAPPAEDTTIILIGNGDRKYGGANVSAGYVTPETQYKLYDITRQYDFASDIPDERGNLLAMLNAWMGFSSVHTAYEDVDINDPNNIVWTEGNTTYVFVPTEDIPLLRPLRQLGLNALADKLNAPLKEIIERAYHRDYLPTPDDPEPTDPATDPEPTDPATDTTDQTDGTTAAAQRVAARSSIDGPTADDTADEPANESQAPAAADNSPAVTVDADADTDSVAVDQQTSGDVQEDDAQEDVETDAQTAAETDLKTDSETDLDKDPGAATETVAEKDAAPEQGAARPEADADADADADAADSDAKKAAAAQASTATAKRAARAEARAAAKARRDAARTGARSRASESTGGHNSSRQKGSDSRVGRATKSRSASNGATASRGSSSTSSSGGGSSSGSGGK